MPRRAAIRSLPFEHPTKPTVGLELFRLADLFERAERDVLGHALETPQRPQFHMICIGLRGRGRLVVDFTPVPLGAGYVTIVASGRVQQFVVATAADRAVDAWLLLVQPSLVGSGASDPLHAPAILSPAWPEPAIAVRPAEQRELLAIVDLLAAEQARPLDAMQPAILAALLRALLLVAERHVGERPPPSGALAQFFTILDRDCTSTRSVAHYAKAAGLSTRRLGELLVAQTGKSTKQVIDERVVLEHKRLLAFTELSVKELADRTGFDEPTNLVKFFRHHTGTTPQAFRQTQRTFLPSGRAS